MTTPERLYLLGHPGAGKAILATMLSEKYNWSIVNADIGLEFHIGKTLDEIFSAAGQKEFLKCQTEVLNLSNKYKKTVIITDVSVVSSSENREYLKHECVFYLKTSTQTQMDRISRQAPPLLNTDIGRFFDRLHEQRDCYFNELADLILDGDHHDIEKQISIIDQCFFQNNLNENLKKQFILTPKEKFIFNKNGMKIQLADHLAICLKLLAKGFSSKHIAKQMSISSRSVETYIASLMEETSTQSSKELIALYHDFK